MGFYKQFFAAAAACCLAISTIHLVAQQPTRRPTYDGAVPGESPYNGPNQAERAAAARARGFNRRERRLVYVALPGGSAGGQFSSEINGQGIIVLDVARNFEFVKRIPTFNTAAAARPAEVAGIARSEEHTSELQSQSNIVCRLLLEKKKNKYITTNLLNNHASLRPCITDYKTCSPR